MEPHDEANPQRDILISQELTPVDLPAVDPGAWDPAAPAPRPADPAAGMGEGTDADPIQPVPYANWRFFGLRSLLLLVVAGTLYLLGVRGVLLVLLAFLGSGLISMFALARQRNAAAGNIENMVQRWNHRIDDRAAAEDED